MLNPAQSLKQYTRLMQPPKRSCAKGQRKSGNPKLPPYTSEVPFELVDYERLIPPTYDVENEDYAHDIAHSMQVSGWSGRPLWGMELEDGDLDMRTGSHRWLALGLLLDAGQWPANLPFGKVPVYVMRRQDVPAKVWRAWEEADFWDMKELGDQGVGPKPVVQLMRAERNPQQNPPAPRLSTFAKRQLETHAAALIDTPAGLVRSLTGEIKRIGKNKKESNMSSRYAVIIPARGNPRAVVLTKQNVEGFKDARGVFHPIRSGDEYDPGQLSDVREYQRSRRKAKKKYK